MWLAALADFDHAGNVVTGGRFISVKGIQKRTFIGETGNIFIYALDDLSSGEQGLSGKALRIWCVYLSGTVSAQRIPEHVPAASA